MIESKNSFGVPDDEIDICIYCEGQVMAGELDSMELCPECQCLALMQCCSCGEMYSYEDMVDDDCKQCVRRY